jgi:hypothetical protein
MSLNDWGYGQGDVKDSWMSMWVDMKAHFAARSLEWFGGIYLINWGQYVLLHPGMFTDPRKADLFKGFIAMGDQQYWGLCVFTAGFIRLTALFINGRWGLTPWIRAITAFLSAGVWFCVSLGVFHTGWNTGVAVYPVMLLADLFSLSRAMSDAAEASANKRLAAKLKQYGLSDKSNVYSLTNHG